MTGWAKLFTKLLLVSATISPIFAQSKILPNGIAAVVEDRIVTYDDIRTEMAPLMKQLYQRNPNPELLKKKVKSLSQDILQNIIDRILIVKQFENDGLTIPKSHVENEYDDVLTRDFNGDRERFLGYLKSQGKSVRQFRKELEERIVVQYMRGRMRKSQSEISPEKIEQYYFDNKFSFYQDESIFLQQILLTSYAEETTDLLLQEAQRIIRDLKNGKTFRELAAKHSRDEKRNKGGEWGWIKRGDIRKELEEIAFQLNATEHSEPIVLDNNVFILRVKEKNNQGVKPLSKVRDEIEGKLQEQLSQEAQRRWVDRLRKKYYIRYY